MSRGDGGAYRRCPEPVGDGRDPDSRDRHRLDPADFAPGPRSATLPHRVASIMAVRSCEQHLTATKAPTAALGRSAAAAGPVGPGVRNVQRSRDVPCAQPRQGL